MTPPPTEPGTREAGYRDIFLLLRDWWPLCCEEVAAGKRPQGPRKNCECGPCQINPKVHAFLLEHPHEYE